MKDVKIAILFLDIQYQFILLLQLAGLPVFSRQFFTVENRHLSFCPDILKMLRSQLNFLDIQY
jgi:hypothetical protein